MSRAQRELRRTLAPVTGIPAQDGALMRRAVPHTAPEPLAQRIKDKQQQVTQGLPKVVP